jgi:predicted nucleotidyltransferase
MNVLGRDLREWLERIRDRLLEYDPEIVEVIQFGSSVYAPEHARDVDLLIITKNPRDYDGYLDAVEKVSPPFNVDIVVIGIGTKLREDFIRGVLGAFNILYGDGKHLLEYAKMLRDPTFDEARASQRVARRLFNLAKETSETLDRDRLFREAFDSLFHAARIAVMTYLSTEVSRWGLLRRILPEPYNKQFREFIDILHIKYSYHGDYPREDVDGEFNKWFSEVERFVETLEKETKRK